MAFISRQSNYLIVGLGGFLQAVGASADVLHHSMLGNADALLSPAVVIIYSGVAMTLLGIWNGGHENQDHNADLSPISFVNTAGLRLAEVGCVIGVVAALWRGYLLLLFNSELLLLSAYGLVNVGVLTVNLGAAVGLTIEVGLIRRQIIFPARWKELLVNLFILLAFASIWITAASALIYVGWIYQSSASDWGVAFFLALMATFVLTPLKRALPWVGSAAGVGFGFSAILYSIIFLYAGVCPYVPWGLLAPCLFDLAIYTLAELMEFKRAAVISSLTIGMLFYTVYFPFTTFLFPWSFYLQPLLILPIAGGAIGALLGNRIYSTLSSTVLRDLAGPA